MAWPTGARRWRLLDNPFGWPVNLPPKVLADGQAPIDAARAAGLKTQRERDYVDALAVFFKDSDKLNHRTRAVALEGAMQTVAVKYPEDTEATILHALIVSATFDPADKKYTNQLKAAKTLDPIFAKQPQHPGVAHYLIHSYDYPPLAAQGLDAARRYASIAPDAAHAQHMPSHIFTRVGFWKDSVDSNRQSARVDGDRTANSPHAYDYMVYAQLQLSQDKAASEVLGHAVGVANKIDNLAAAYAYAAMPARLALERGLWAEAAKLPLVPAADAYPWKKYPQAEALNAFARGLGAAMSRDAAAAGVEVARLQALRDAARELEDHLLGRPDRHPGRGRSRSGQHRRRQEGRGAGRHCEPPPTARTRPRSTSSRRASSCPRARCWPSCCSTTRKAAEALRGYEMVLTKEPNRYRAFAGAMQAAERAGDAKKTAFFAERLLEQAAAADTQRPELAQARKVLGR